MHDTCIISLLECRICHRPRRARASDPSFRPFASLSTQSGEENKNVVGPSSLHLHFTQRFAERLDVADPRRLG